MTPVNHRNDNNKARTEKIKMWPGPRKSVGAGWGAGFGGEEQIGLVERKSRREKSHRENGDTF